MTSQTANFPPNVVKALHDLLARPSARRAGSIQLKAERLEGGVSEVYKVSLTSPNETIELIIKTDRRIDNEGVYPLQAEYEICEALVNHATYLTPSCIFSLLDEGNIYTAYELIQGSRLDTIKLHRKELVRLSEVIYNLECDLSNLSCSPIKKVMSRKAQPIDYAGRITKFILRDIGIELQTHAFAELPVFLNEPCRMNFRCIVSDRSPANWIMSPQGALAAIDFGLVRVGYAQEDWAWLIDDHRLNSTLRRKQILELFIKSAANRQDQTEAESLFHFCAIYVNLVQAAMFYKARRDASKHCIRHATSSAKILGLTNTVSEIKKLDVAYV